MLHSQLSQMSLIKGAVERLFSRNTEERDLNRDLEVARRNAAQNSAKGSGELSARKFTSTPASKDLDC